MKISYILLSVLCLITFVNLKKIEINRNFEKYSKVVDLINETLTNNVEFKHHAWNQTAFLVDSFGPRLLGSESLELALKYMHKVLIMEGFENVKLEKVKYKKKWIRTFVSLKPAACED